MDYSSKATFTKMQLITPEMAADMLEHNTNNRNLSQKTVDYYARMITDGQWKTTNQGIGFFKNGTLADGQHRLHAIVKANKAVVMNVMYGIEDDATFALDNLRARTVRDALVIMGRDIPKYIIGSIRAAADCEEKVPSYTIAEFYDNHEEWCNITRKIFTKSTVGISNRGVGGAILTLLAAGEPPEVVSRFCDAMRSECQIDNSDGARTVCRYAIKLRTTKNGTGYKDVRRLLCTTQRIYDAFRDNKYLAAIKMIDEPRYPFIEIKK